MAPGKKEIIIRKSLEKGYPIEMSFAGHSVLIYGADYDDAGRSLKYHIKDSYYHDGSVTYEVDAGRAHDIIWELSTVDLRDAL